MIMNFIFTRCAMPTMCSAATARMAALQDHTGESGIRDLQFVSISFDPEYDTPGILKAYMMNYDIDPRNFSFLAGEPSAIRDILTQSGVVAKAEAGTINHTLATILIDTNGRILFRKDGSRWDVDDFLTRLQ